MPPAHSAANLDKLPLGAASFDAIRRGGLIYVDKTEGIIRPIHGSRYTSLSRPHGFGKTLLINAVAALLSRGASAFEGLQAVKHWHEDVHPVVRLDFSLLQAPPSAEAFSAALNIYLQAALSSAGFRSEVFAAAEPMDPVRRWRQFLQAADDGSLVVLIDDCDAPLAARLQ